MGGGGPRQTQTQTYPPWAIPSAVGYLNTVGQYVNADLARGYNPQFNQQIAPFTPYQQQGFGLGASMAGVDPSLINPTYQNYAATQQGKYLDPSTNPWLKKTFEAAAQPVTQEFRDTTAPGIAGMFARAGSFGGSAGEQAMSDAQKNLGISLDNLATNIYGGNYQQERQNQLQQQGMLGSLIGAGFMPSQELLALGGQQQQQGQNILDAIRQNAIQKQQYPYDVLNQLGNAITAAVGNQGVSKITSGGKGLF